MNKMKQIMSRQIINTKYQNKTEQMGSLSFGEGWGEANYYPINVPLNYGRIQRRRSNK